MKFLGLLIAITLVSVTSFSAHAGKKVQKGKALPQGVNLSTDIQFNANTLHGRYQTPGEALARVEDEKNLNDLLVPRTHFKDRMAFEGKGNR
jgi:hypothetical protein